MIDISSTVLALSEDLSLIHISSMQKDGTGTLMKVFGAINKLPDERKIAALNTLFNLSLIHICVLADKAPAALKVAVNTTARQTRKLMLQEAVSYTHLDVYKRQALPCSSRAMGRAIWLPSEKTRPKNRTTRILLPMSWQSTSARRRCLTLPRAKKQT